MPASKTTTKALAQAKWQSSGLTGAAAKILKLKPLVGSETAALGNFHPVASLQIPYFDLDGKPTGFYRLRYLEDLPGFAGQVEKPQRYAQPKGTLNEVYLPPLLKEGWQAIADDPTVAICITEGELKAASATAAGYPTIGLGGVDVWRSSKRAVPLLPQLAEIKWNGRPVTIIFDSDAASNPAVTAAQRRLAAELVTLGAIPKIAAIPPGHDGEKVGLDDFLLARGAEALMEVIETAPAFPEGDALWKLNEEVIYARDPGIVVERNTGRRIRVSDFVSHAYANRHYTAQVTTAAGKTVMKREPLAPRWVEWEHRFEVEKIVYSPGKPRLDGNTWNTWGGWGAEEEQGDVSLWNGLLDFFFPDDPAARRWFEQWCAYPIQHPGTKLYTSVLFWSTRHGTGKSLLAYLLRAVYGQSNTAVITSEHLRGAFNGWAENKQLVIGEEITAGDARLDKDKLKGLITQATVRVNQKFLPEYEIRDCINYIFNSNSPDAMFVEDNDRRYFVQEIAGGPLPREFYEKCDAWLHGKAGANLLYHLRRVDLTGFNPREHAYVTASKRNMIYNGKSDMGIFVADLKEDPAAKLRPLGEEVATKCELFTASQILRCYDPEGVKRVTAIGLAKEMIRSGFRPLNGGSPIRTKAGIHRLYAIRNHDDWVARPVTEMARHYEKFMLDAQKF